jgi:hypothetical protein
MEEITISNIGQLFEKAPNSTNDIIWNTFIITEEDFNKQKEEIELLSNVVIYHSTDSPLIMQLWNSLETKKNYNKEGEVIPTSWQFYRFMYIYTS